MKPPQGMAGSGMSLIFNERAFGCPCRCLSSRATQGSGAVTALSHLLDTYRSAAVTEREKGTYFEDLILAYLRNEATYRDLYSQVWTWAEWAPAHGFTGKDDGIDLVAQDAATGEFHAIQCKFYDPYYKLQKKDIDSFFTASGKKPFTYRIIISTTDHWSEHAENALVDQQPPVSKITLHDLENSQIDWAKFQPKKAPVLKPKKKLMPHQDSALAAVQAGLKGADRGKMIMACGTGKTFTSLKIAEALAGRGKRVLFLVPSLSLLSQSLTEWTQESDIPLHSFAVCSDSDVGKKKGRKEDDAVQTLAHELRYPATTDAARLAKGVALRQDDDHMTVVFSTYHSIEVIHEAQAAHGLGDFDLIVCDEAHRTTGATYEGADESAFVRVHDAAYIRSARRLYMTATPRIYGDSAKAVAERDNVALYSMDNEAWYGKQLFVITFSEAVKRGLLVDYKVIVLAVEESHINRRLQKLLADGDNQLRVDDAAKIVGCWKALAKLGITEDGSATPEPMKRAVAFCQVIEPNKGAKVHKVSSKEIAGMFQAVVEAYQASEDVEEAAQLVCEARHVDGSMNAGEKEAKLDWLKAPTPPETCRILSNVRCLSEGVDVPALDAVLFLTPRNSQVDVVQSVGRVMRRAEGKKRGYVVLPVVIPAGVEPHEALSDNKTYAVVWQVLQALRSHDDRFDAMVNKLDLVGPDRAKMEVIAIADKVQPKASHKDAKAVKAGKAKGKYAIGDAGGPYDVGPEQTSIPFEVGEIERALYAKVVEKCGNRHHWEDWANDIAKIAQTHIDRIKALLEDPAQVEAHSAFNHFARELRDDLNDKVSDDEIIEMLAQHLITKPVFEALFADYSFATNNPMSKAMQAVLDILDTQNLSKETATLKEFYASVKLRAEGIESAQGKQKIIVDLYDKFFRNAFPKMTERLGIVYTPVEIVDLILRGVDELLRVEFDQSISSDGVHLLDPFTGTGTFITRLLQSGLIGSDSLQKKYAEEIHANEIVLLAYYIAAINIEAAYHGLVGGSYLPFEGICLTDTFQMYEKDDLIDQLLIDNSGRRKKQKELKITVVVGNPPYSVGQASANDNNQNVEYPTLDGRIAETYAARSAVSKVRSLYDSYVRAFRWASDRIGDAGVIGFVTNSGFLESNSASGVRRCFVDEFSSVYVLNLRGNIRKNMATKGSAAEGQNVFGSASMTGIAITFLVKTPGKNGPAVVNYCDIGDSLTRVQKLDRLAESRSITSAFDWQTIQMDEHGDWLGQRNASAARYMVMGAKTGDQDRVFEVYSSGIQTKRDAWAIAFSRANLRANVARMISHYNDEMERFHLDREVTQAKDLEAAAMDFVDKDPRKISWTSNLVGFLVKKKLLRVDPEEFKICLVRPFTKAWVYGEKHFVWSRYRLPAIFRGDGQGNRVIMIKQRWGRRGQIALMADVVPEFQPDGGAQCFPLYLYNEKSVLDVDSERRYAVTDEAHSAYQAAFGEVGKEDIFYYIYGLLHSSCFRERFADNLSKEIPRIPIVRRSEDFWAFSTAGRELAELHVNFDAVEKYALTIETSSGKLADSDFRVESMKFAKKKHPETGKSINDRSTVIYNKKITLKGIPEAAWDYVVNGKAALDWVMERQAVRVDKDSGIVNDANDWATETMGNPTYPLELFQRVVTVSLETQRIVASLPKLDTFD